MKSISDHFLRAFNEANNLNFFTKVRTYFNNFFLNLQKQRGTQNTIKKLIIDDMKFKDQTCILDHIKDFYEILFKKHKQKTKAKIKDFLNAIAVPKLFEDQVKLCEEHLTERDLYKSLRSMKNNKSLGNDGLTKGFYETFCH